MRGLISRGRSVVASFPAMLCLAVAGVMLVANSAFAQVTLPATGVDVDDYVTATVTALGVIVAVCVGAFFAFLLIGKGLAWGRKALGAK